MIWKISIFRESQEEEGEEEERRGCCSSNGRPYGSEKCSCRSNHRCSLMILNNKMFNLAVYILLAGLVFLVSPVRSDQDFYPGLRRPPIISTYNQPQTEENSFLLAQLTSIIEEQARRRFQEQLAQQRYYQRQFLHHRGPNAQDDESIEPSFTYQFPDNAEQSISGEIPFAVSPSDPRYYESSTSDIVKSKSYEDERDLESKIKSNLHAVGEEFGMKANDDAPYYKLKSPMNVNPKLATNEHLLQNSIAIREDLNDLVQTLQKNGHANAIINGEQVQQRTEVVKKHMGMDGAMGMYIVALIAGVSAAVTVGLIALGIGWYTLHKKAKAAADVDYPAYGVTGPNKDISPSGDRRLAQSAQMYHYQHQKQQIIAMENRTAGDHHPGISDVESDDDNEEGDYTVYECPGLAPTGEMEVKNPLFLDDTPVTPSTNITPADDQQQQQTKSQKTNEKNQRKPPPPSNP